jgi:hypothetical protein
MALIRGREGDYYEADFRRLFKQISPRDKTRTASARKLAQCWYRADQEGYTFEWQNDDEPWEPGDTDYEPQEVLGLVMKDPQGNVVDSLWGIADPTKDYAFYEEANMAYAHFG